MTHRVFPVTGTDMTEADWERLYHAVQPNGVIGDPADATLQVFADGTGMHVFVRTGDAYIRGHVFTSDAQDQLTIADNATGNPRIDRVILKLDPGASAGSRIVLTMKAGTAGATPVAPALTQTPTGVFELSLAEIRVEAGSVAAEGDVITYAKITDERQYTGTYSVACTSTTRPTSPRVGQWIFEIDTNDAAYWNGSTWIKPYDQVKPYVRRFASSPVQPLFHYYTVNGTQYLQPDWTPLAFDTVEISDGIALATGSASAVAAPANGVYRVRVHILAQTGGYQDLQLMIRKNAGGNVANGSTLDYQGAPAYGSQNGHAAIASDIPALTAPVICDLRTDVQLAAGDTVEPFFLLGNAQLQPGRFFTFIEVEFLRP